VNRSPSLRFFIAIVAAALLGVTIYLNCTTVRAVLHGQTNVLSRDQWWFLGELQSLYEGRNWAQLLWSPYWGHRPVLVRLLFYLDARAFAFRSGPLICLTWTCLISQILLLAAVNRALFGAFFVWRYAAALIVLLNLCLSSFQMENLIWALQVQYVLAFFCAVLSFFLLSLSAERKRSTLLVSMSCLAALAGSLTMAHGLFIWPALALQAYVCNRSRKLSLGLLAAFIVLAGIYAVNYQMPSTGMGVIGQLRRPMRGLEISLMVVAGSISNRSLTWGVASGGFGVASLAIFLFQVKRSARPTWPSVYVATALFALATASVTAAGRISPELLKLLIAGHNELLPSRYQTFGYVFWISLFSLALWSTQTVRQRGWRLLAIPALAVPVFVVVADGREQLVYSQAWMDAMRSVDATGISLLLNAQDWEREQILWSDRPQLMHWVDFTRSRRLAVFSEGRYGWLGSAMAERFQITPSNRCEGKTDLREMLPGGTGRVTGWAWDRDFAAPPLDVLLVNVDGRVVGLARCGLPHHDTGGHSSQVVIWRAGWLGYCKPDAGPVRAFAVLQDGRSVCALAH
jgi:hypothetical protein